MRCVSETHRLAGLLRVGARMALCWHFQAASGQDCNQNEIPDPIDLQEHFYLHDGGAFPIGSAPLELAAGDLDGDGDVDLASANRNSGDVTILLGDGRASFIQGETCRVGDDPVAIASGDLDGDGALDLAAIDVDTKAVVVLKNRGDGTFEASTGLPAGDDPRALVAADLDADGNLDLAVADGASRSVSLLFRERDGAFTGSKVAAGFDLRTLVAGDFDGDGQQFKPPCDPAQCGARCFREAPAVSHRRVAAVHRARGPRWRREA